MLSALKEIGIRFLEIAPTRVISEHPYDRLDEAKRFADGLYENYEMRICSMQSIWYGRTERLFRGEEDIVKLRAYTEQAICFAEAIGCGNLVFGCPRNRNIEGEEEKKNLDCVYAFFQYIGDFAAAHNTCFSLEANPVLYHTNFINTTAEALQLAGQIKSPGLKVNLDCGTIIANDESVDELKFDQINHIHISEPGLIKIKDRGLHWEVLKRAAENGYEKYVSVEMGQSSRKDVEEVLLYVARLMDVLKTEKCEIDGTVR